MTERAPLKPKFHAILVRQWVSTVERIREDRESSMVEE
jgi:hypothetical protein